MLEMNQRVVCSLELFNSKLAWKNTLIAPSCEDLASYHNEIINTTPSKSIMQPSIHPGQLNKIDTSL